MSGVISDPHGAVVPDVEVVATRIETGSASRTTTNRAEIYVFASLRPGHYHLEGFRTARYQYIPALALPRRGELNLKLNNPPSFQKPMSVLVFSLPPIEPNLFPPQRASNPSSTFCLQQPSLVLPVEGSPLVYVTDLVHDPVLRIKTKSGPSVDLPISPNPARGGYVVDTRNLRADSLDAATSGTIRAYWGFATFDGPSFQLRNSRSTNGRLLPPIRPLLSSVAMTRSACNLMMPPAWRRSP